MAPHHRRSVPRGLAFLTAGVVAAASLAPGTAFGADAASRPDPRPSAPAPHTPARVAPYNPAFGAFLHYGPVGVQRMEQLGRWLGGHELRVGHTYLPGDVWENIEGGHGFLDSWAEWRRAKPDRLLVLNVPMLERNEDDLPDRAVRQLLRRAASGAFDDHFETLARRLVRLGVPDAVIVLGWEMNGITYTHRCAPDPDSWKRYWRRIVTVMRSVPGQKFRFDFTPSRGMDAIPWPECYPGDDVVDIIGMDAYDQPRGLGFDEQVSEPYGLRHHVDFARMHGKPISYPEWGLFRNGDNITYMLRMLAWMDEHKPLYNTITDYCPHGVWLCSDNPRASALYRLLLSTPLLPRPEPGPSVPVPDMPTAPAEPDTTYGPDETYGPDMTYGPDKTNPDPKPATGQPATPAAVPSEWAERYR